MVAAAEEAAQRVAAAAAEAAQRAAAAAAAAETRVEEEAGWRAEGEASGDPEPERAWAIVSSAAPLPWEPASAVRAVPSSARPLAKPQYLGAWSAAPCPRP